MQCSKLVRLSKFLSSVQLFYAMLILEKNYISELDWFRTMHVNTLRTLTCRQAGCTAAYTFVQVRYSVWSPPDWNRGISTRLYTAVGLSLTVAARPVQSPSDTTRIFPLYWMYDYCRNITCVTMRAMFLPKLYISRYWGRKFTGL